MKILLVDDNTYACDALFEFLELLPYETDFTYSAKEAAKLITHNHYDLLITDLNMPEMGGIELFSLIQKQQLITGVIFVSGENEQAEGPKLLEQGAYAFLSKPIDVFALAALLENYASLQKK